MYLLALAPALAFAQQQSETAPENTTLDRCWQAGSGASFFKVCISKHGNVVGLQSPAGQEHIRVGQIMEGYLVCLKLTPESPRRVYFDAGNHENGGWLEPYLTTNNPTKIYRKSPDGRLELVQEFVRDLLHRNLTINMTLINRSTETLYDVNLDRYVDLDINNTWLEDVFDRGSQAVLATESGRQVSLTELSPMPSTIAVHSGGGGFGINVCNAPSVTTPTAAGDWIGRISFNFGTVAAGASKTVKLRYRVL
jgi:hypothetical protein